MLRSLCAVAAVILLAGPASGATIAVHVARNGDHSPLDVRLGLTRDEREPDWISVRRLAANRDDLTLRDVGAGSYTLLLEGPRPLQRVSAHVVVGADDHRAVTIRITPQPFHGRFTLAGTPLGKATVSVYATDFMTSAMTDAHGVIDEPRWQSGDAEFVIDSPSLGAPYRARAHLAARVAIEIESRVVRGIVTDAHGTPVEDAGVVLSAEDETHRVPRRTATNAKGEFRIDGVTTGAHSLRVAASGYLRGKPVALQIANHEHVENIVLDAGVGVPVEVVDAMGEAVAGATLVCATDGVVRSTAHTDTLGRAVVATPPGGDSMLFVLPREGSFVAQPTSGARRITIPDSDASLQVDALADGAPLTGVTLLVRYNGTMIPPEVARMLGTSFVTDAQGRVVLPHVAPGAYELWPYRSDEEAEALMASQSALAAPINLAVAPGENRVTVRFKSRK